MTLSAVYRIFILILIAASVLFVCFHPLKESQYGPQSDEGYYLKYASMVSHQGLPAFNELLSWYAASDEARKHPAPVRAGYMLLGAFLFKLGGAHFSLLGLISMVSFLLFLYVSFYYVRKYFDVDTALISVLFLSSSPLLLGLSRRALADSPANLLWGLAVWLFLDVLLRQKHFSYVCFLIVLTAAIMFKEASVILIAFFMLAGVLGRNNGALIKPVQILGILIWPAVVVIIFYGWIYGGPVALKAAVSALIQTHFMPHSPNPYAVNYSSGPWFRYLIDFLLLTPIVTLLFIGYCGHSAIQRQVLDFKKGYLLGYFAFVYAVLSSLPHSKVVRFAANLEMVMALGAALMLALIFQNKKQRWLVGAAFVIFLLNWTSFVDLFYKPGLLDPISYHLLVLRHFIPQN